MDEKGANTFPFHNLPTELKKIISKVFPVLFTHSFIWIKEKSVMTLANRNICENKRKTSSQFSHRITELATLLGRFLKWSNLRA